MALFGGTNPPPPQIEQWMRDMISTTPTPIPPPPLPPGPFFGDPPVTVTSCEWSPASKFKETGIDPLQLLTDRLRIPRNKRTFKGIDHVHIYAAADKVVVMYYKAGAANIIEEDASMFPSDSLVAQFHLLMG